DEAVTLVAPNSRFGARNEGLETLVFNSFVPRIELGRGDARRAFSRRGDYARPGVYIMVNGARKAYLGMGGKLGARIAAGNQPIDDVKLIVAISDTNDGLDEFDARALERIMWSRLVASGECELINDIPDGAPIDVQ